ncbi:TlpA disulfide reductase family protein [Myceligenerans cantabricum]
MTGTTTPLHDRSHRSRPPVSARHATGPATGPRPRTWGHRGPAGLAIALAAVAAVALAGCTAADSGAGDIAGQGYVSGDGSVRTWEDGERDGPVEIAGDLFDGGEAGTADWAGDVVVLNTWYAGCPPCRAEAPDLADLANEYEDDGVHFLGINTEDDAPTAQAFERTFSMPYPSIEDRSGRVIADLSGITSLQSVPTTVVLDREGLVAARILGQADRSTLETLITDVLAEEA